MLWYRQGPAEVLRVASRPRTFSLGLRPGILEAPEWPDTWHELAGPKREVIQKIENLILFPPPRSTRKPRSLMCPASYTRTRNSVSIGSHTSGRCRCGIGFRRSQRSSSPSFCGGIGRVQHHGRSGSPLGPILGKASRLPKRERCYSEMYYLDNEYSDR